MTCYLQQDYVSINPAGTQYVTKLDTEDNSDIFKIVNNSSD